MERFAPATANKMLCALRRVLKALRLDLIDAQDYAKAVDFPSIKVAKGLRGRADEMRRFLGFVLKIPRLGARCGADCDSARCRVAAG